MVGKMVRMMVGKPRKRIPRPVPKDGGQVLKVEIWWGNSPELELGSKFVGRPPTEIGLVRGARPSDPSQPGHQASRLSTYQLGSR